MHAKTFFLVALLTGAPGGAAFAAEQSINTELGDTNFSEEAIPDSNSEQSGLTPGAGEENATGETNEAVLPRQTRRHSDLGRQVQTDELIPDSTTEASGLTEGAEEAVRN